jgi:HSP20 family molecular chaperone IbpA
MRRFQRSFVLGGGLQVRAARLENGLLNIELQQTEPAAARTIRVGTAGPEDV